jgi:hypothetical protein
MRGVPHGESGVGSVICPGDFEGTPAETRCSVPDTGR